MKGVVPPRIYGICAVEADVVALIARSGPLTHIFKWDLSLGTLEAGARFRGTAYPRRCDISPDGQFLFGYFMRHGDPHTVISRLPWVYGLMYEEEVGTWGRGKWFMVEHDEATPWTNGPAVMVIKPSDRITLRLSARPNGPFFNEERRGWREAADCPPLLADDVWDNNRSKVILERSSPRQIATSLRLERGKWNCDRPGIEGYRPIYFWRATPGAEWRPLMDAAWADFSRSGRLVYTTWAGEAIEAEVMDGDGCEVQELRVVQRHDLSKLPTDVTRAPEWARRWE